jgi:pimeloyl-ACP methyl ester carboxylesterase
VAAACRAFAKFDAEAQLRGLPAPTLVLAGELDVSTGPEVMRPIAANLPGSHYVELPAAPRMPTLETPNLVEEDTFLPRVNT